jgi:hypothetical protein
MIGAGAGDCEKSWRLEEGDEEVFLTIFAENEPTCVLREYAGNVWKGRWQRFEKMPIILSSQSPLRVPMSESSRGPAKRIANARKSTNSTWPSILGSERKPKWGAYMMSCRKRLISRTRTLQRLARTDWPWGCRVVVDELDESDKDGEEVGMIRVQRAAQTYKRVLEETIRDGLDFSLYVEDDVLFNVHLWHNLLHWSALDDVTLASLYNPGIAGLSISPKKHCNIAIPENIYGSQCFLVSRECAFFMLENWHCIPPDYMFLDRSLPRLAGMMGRPIYYHRPSLVQHDDGVSSSWPYQWPKHFAVDFDESFIV